MNCPVCGFKISLAVLRQKEGKKFYRIGYGRYCIHIDCDWDSGKVDFPQNDHDIKLNEINRSK